jgi:hypothetical protein
MKTVKNLFILFLIITFLAGIYVILNPCKSIETMENNKNNDNDENNTDCPNLLIEKDGMLLLYNKNKPEDDTNPIPFFTLDEYIYYLEMQRKKGSNCPVLYLQKENNAQGNDVYRIRPSPFDKEGGLPPISNINDKNLKKMETIPPVKPMDANREHSPYNDNNYNSFDPYGQYIGIYTTVDAIHDSTNKNNISDNPMDPNWGGVDVTQNSINSGKYEDNNIVKPLLYQPKMAFLPIEKSDMELPKDVY